MPSRNGPRTPLRFLAAAAAGLALAGLALPAGCHRGWSAREHRTVVETLEAIEASAARRAEAPLVAPETKKAAEGPVRLSLQEAIRLALAHNPDVQIAGYEPLRAEADLVEARAVYDPTVFGTNQFGRNKRPIQSTLDTGAVTDAALTEDTWKFSAGLRQRLPTGGTLSLSQQMEYLDTNSRLIVPNPQYTSGLALEWSQPLLKNLGDPEARAAIRVATLAAGVSLHQFRQKVMEVVAEVTAAYWQLAFTREMVKVQEESLREAEEVLRRERARAQKGISNELNIARAASAVASRRVALVRARNRAGDAADRLKRLLAAPSLPVHGRAEVIPADPPRFFLTEVDRAVAMAQALAHRPELAQARTRIDMSRIRLDAADRQRLPKLDALLRYTLNGLGEDLADAVDMQDLRDPVTWVAGLELEWPLGNRAARAEFRRRRIDYEQMLLEADRLTDQVLEEVSVAVRAVQRGRDEVEASLQAQEAARTVLEGEQTRMELQPMDRRTNEELLRAQAELAQARQDHLLALLNFNLALTELARAQGTLLEDLGIEVVWPEPVRPGRPAPVRVGGPERGLPTEAEADEAPAAKAP